MSDLVKADATQWEVLRSQASSLVASGLLPKSIRTAEQAIAIALAGKELGLPMMQAFRSLNIIDGKPTMSADLMAGLVHKHIKGAKLRVAETTEERCVVEAARPGQEPTTIVFSMEDAKRAGLLGKDNWKKYPRAMLRARCLAEACRAVFPDATMGIYDPDELGAVTTPDGEVLELTPVYSDPADLLEGIHAAENALEGGDVVDARKKLADARAQLSSVGTYLLSPRYQQTLKTAYCRVLEAIQKKESEQP